MGKRPPRMLRQRERGRSDRAFVIIDGRRHKLGVWGSLEAEQRYRELLAGLTLASRDVAAAASSPEPAPLPENPTVAELMVDFLRDILERFDKNKAEVAHYRGALRVLKEEFAELPATEFGPRRLRHVQSLMVAKGWSRRYVNGQIGRVRRLFRWAAGDERIDVSVYQALQTVEALTMGRTTAPEPRGVGPVDDATVDATLPHLSDVVADMVRVQRLCGCRPKELCTMTAEQIDRSGDVWVYRPDRHKTSHKGKHRAIALGPKAQRILTPYLFADGELFPYDSAGYRQCVRRACERAWPAPEGSSHSEELEWNRAHRWAPNQLRHAVATRVRAEYGVEGAQHVLGHAKADMAEHYAQRSIDLAQKIAKNIG